MGDEASIKRSKGFTKGLQMQEYLMTIILAGMLVCVWNMFCFVWSSWEYTCPDRVEYDLDRGGCSDLYLEHVLDRVIRVVCGVCAVGVRNVI